MQSANIAIFNKALVGLNKLVGEFPSNILVKSIKLQLKYLIDLEEGKEKDRSRLPEINLGLITVREIEGKDDELANILYEVNSIAKAMMTEK